MRANNRVVSGQMVMVSSLTGSAHCSHQSQSRSLKILVVVVVVMVMMISTRRMQRWTKWCWCLCDIAHIDAALTLGTNLSV